MTSGLRKLAGDQLRQWLARSTRNTLSGVATGATMTALIQSSSATTVAAIGFVGAQLITFSQSLGIIFGANIGTTITGWMVALLGFKLKLSAAALPLLFAASICYLFKQSNFLRGFGKALAGFCLIFIGISYLQEGLSQFQGVIDLGNWPATNFGGRLLLLGIGVLLTLLTQSSSATVATAITALNASLIDLPQAAAIIIGADIGTTGTAALATIGGSTAARRTGFAHVIYNLMTGIAAFVALPGYLWIWDQLSPGAVSNSAELVAVSFHSAFNVLGVILVLPFAKHFGRLIETIIPERKRILTEPFDAKLLEDAPSAAAGLEFGVRRISGEMLRVAAHALRNDPEPDTKERPIYSGSEIDRSVEVARNFAVQLGTKTTGGTFDSSRVFECIHALDHVNRLCDRTRDLHRAEAAHSHTPLATEAREIAILLQTLADQIQNEAPPPELAKLQQAAADLEDRKSQSRRQTIADAAGGKLNADQLDDILDSQRWLRRMVYHAWRIGYYTWPNVDIEKESSQLSQEIDTNR